MDITTLTLFTQNTLPLLQPYLPILAAEAAKAVGKELPAAAGKLWQGIKAKFDMKAAAKEALTDLLAEPDNTDVQGAFRQQLKKALREDEAFAAEFQKLFAAAETEAKSTTTYQAYATGGAAVAQGEGAKAVGKGGILIEGDVGGDFSAGGEKHEKGKKPS